MADQPKRDKSTGPSRQPAKAPSRDKREGGDGKPKEGFPRRIERKGARRHHDRELTTAESKAREGTRRAAREAEVKAHGKAREDRQPKGWAGRRAGRSARGR